MPTVFPDDSVGLVSPQTLHFNEPLELTSGKSLAEYDLVIETYGELNATQSNAVLICHALSGHHHAAGYHSVDERKPGWWDSCIGPGKPIDTRKFFVVALNNLGGCNGSSGPASINPATGKVYGADFPTAAGGVMSATDEREAKEITRILYVNTVFAVVLFWSMAVGRHPFL